MLVSFAAAMPPLLFDIINALIGATFLFLLFFLIFGQFPRDRRGRALYALLLLLILCTTMFGSVFVWISGAVNYLWGFLLILLWWLPIRFFLSSGFTLRKWWQVLLYVVLGVLAGWCSEQVGILSIVVAGSLILFRCIQRQPLPMWLWGGFFAFCAGFAILYFCPGAQSRSGEYDNYLSLGELASMGVLPLLKRCVLTIRFCNSFQTLNAFIAIWWLYRWVHLGQWKKWAWAGVALIWIPLQIWGVAEKKFLFTSAEYLLTNFGLLAWSIWVIVRNWTSRKSNVKWAVAWLYVLYFIALLSTVQLAGEMPERAKFAPALLLIAAMLYMAEELLPLFRRERLVQAGIEVLACCAAVVTVYAYVDWRRKVNRVETEIFYQKSLGNTEIVLSKELFDPLIPSVGDWGNPGQNPDVWPNTSYAEHYGVGSVIVK